MNEGRREQKVEEGRGEARRYNHRFGCTHMRRTTVEWHAWKGRQMEDIQVALHSGFFLRMMFGCERSGKLEEGRGKGRRNEGGDERVKGNQGGVIFIGIRKLRKRTFYSVWAIIRSWPCCFFCPSMVGVDGGAES
jgi:hypothetical protein